MYAKSCKALVFFLVNLELNSCLSGNSHEICKTQQGIHSSPALETGGPVIRFVNHLVYAEEKVINLGLCC